MHTILEELKKLGSPTQREVLMRFFKTGPGQYGAGDRFLGVKVPQTRAVVKVQWATCSDAERAALISSPYHEARLAGLLVLICQYKAARRDEAARARLVDVYLNSTDFINNWDLVDLTCYELLGDWLLTRDRRLLFQMASTGKTLWIQRIAIVTTLQFIRHGEFETTLALADILLPHPHDLIHKAVGWMLREVGKRDQTVLETFLGPRYQQMPRTMLRYAIEKFPSALRLQYLHGQI